MLNTGGKPCLASSPYAIRYTEHVLSTRWSAKPSHCMRLCARYWIHDPTNIRFVITCDPFMYIGCNTVGGMVRTRGYPWLCHCEAYPGTLRLTTVQLGNTPILTPGSSDFDSLSMSQIHNPQVCDLGTHPNHCLCNTADNHGPGAPIPWLRHCMAYPGTLRLTTVQPQYVAILTPHLSIFDQYLMSWISDFMIWTSNSGLVDVYPRGVVFISGCAP